MDFRDTLHQVLTEIEDLLLEKNKAYGNSYEAVPTIFKLLYPTGVPVDQYNNALILVRMLDKFMRIANGDTSEDAWTDLIGYATVRKVTIEKQKHNEKDPAGKVGNYLSEKYKEKYIGVNADKPLYQVVTEEGGKITGFYASAPLIPSEVKIEKPGVLRQDWSFYYENDGDNERSSCWRRPKTATENAYTQEEFFKEQQRINQLKADGWVTEADVPRDKVEGEKEGERYCKVWGCTRSDDHGHMADRRVPRQVDGFANVFSQECKKRGCDTSKSHDHLFDK